MSEHISVRKGQERDCQVLVDFNIAMARETEGKELSRKVVSEGVRNLLRNPQNGFYVIAERGNDVTGCLMVTTEWSDWRNGEFWWIQSVYVKPEFRRQGIYRTLYDFVRSKAAEKDNVCGFRLYVEQKNAVAQQTYRQMGMEEAPYKIFEELTNR